MGGSKEIRERHDRTERALLALANDIVALNDANERVVSQIRALALEYRIELPETV